MAGERFGDSLGILGWARQIRSRFGCALLALVLSACPLIIAACDGQSTPARASAFAASAGEGRTGDETTALATPRDDAAFSRHALETQRLAVSNAQAGGFPKLPEDKCLGTGLTECNYGLYYEFSYELTGPAGAPVPTFGVLVKSPFVLDSLEWEFLEDGRALEVWTLSSEALGSLAIRRSAFGPESAIEVGHEYFVSDEETKWGRHFQVEDDVCVVLEHANITKVSDAYEISGLGALYYGKASIVPLGYCDVFPRDFDGCLCSVPISVERKFLEQPLPACFEGRDYLEGGGGDWFMLVAARQGIDEDGDTCIRIVYETRYWVEVILDD